MKTEIPASVIAAAAGLLSLYKPSFEYLGKHGTKDVYMFLFPKGELTGFPYLYLYENGHATEVTGFRAVRLLRSLDVE